MLWLTKCLPSGRHVLLRLLWGESGQASFVSSVLAASTDCGIVHPLPKRNNQRDKYITDQQRSRLKPQSNNSSFLQALKQHGESLATVERWTRHSLSRIFLHFRGVDNGNKRDRFWLALWERGNANYYSFPFSQSVSEMPKENLTGQTISQLCAPVNPEPKAKQLSVMIKCKK